MNAAETPRQRILRARIQTTTGVLLSHDASNSILDGVDDYADTLLGETQLITKETWNAANFNIEDTVEQDMIKRLAVAAVIQGYLPIELPRHTITYLRSNFTEYVEVPQDSNAWDMVKIDFRMRVRRP